MDGLLFAFGTVLVALFLVMFYRSSLENHERHQIFLDGAGHQLAGQQSLIVVRLGKVDRVIQTLYAVAGALFLAIVALGFRQLLNILKLFDTTTSQ